MAIYPTNLQGRARYSSGFDGTDLIQVPEETFEQKVERFKKSEYFIAEKEHKYGVQIVVWKRQVGFNIFTNFKNAMQFVYFK